MHRKQDAKNHHYAHQWVQDLLIARQKGPEDLIMQSQGDKNTGKLAGCGSLKVVVLLGGCLYQQNKYLVLLQVVSQIE